MKKIISLLIASLFILLSFSACSNAGQPDSTTAPAAVTDPVNTAPEESTRLYPQIPEGTDLKGDEFVILYYDTAVIHNLPGIPVDVWVEAQNGDVLNDAVFKRNKNVEEALNVTVTMFAPVKGKYISTIQTAVSSGDQPYSMLDIDCNDVVNLFNKNLIYSTAVLETDFEKPWYDQAALEQLSICGKSIAFAPDTIYMDKLETVVTFYNKALGEDLGIGSLHQTAIDGKFTLETMLQYADAVSADLNQDGKMDSNDAYVISSQNDYGYYSLLGAGSRSAYSTADTIELNTSDERLINILQRTGEIITDSHVFYNRQSFSATTTQVAQMFANKQFLFLIRPLQSLYDLRNFDHSFEILPVAKFDDDQDHYYAPVNTYAGTIFCVPVGRTDYENIALVSDLLAAESYYEVMPVFYDVVLDFKLVNDPGAAAILDIVFDNRSYDLGLMFNIGSVRNVLVSATWGNVVSSLKGVEKLSTKSIKTLVEAINNIER